MFTSSTSQQLTTFFKEQEALNSFEQKLLIDNKSHSYLNGNWEQLARLINMSLYNEFYIAEEQLKIISASKVSKRRKQIKNISRKRDLFKYFIRTCVNRFDGDEF